MGVLVVGALLVPVGLVGALGVAAFAVRAEHRAPMVRSSGTATLHLEAVTYVVYEEVPRGASLPTRVPGTVQVTSADGTALALRRSEDRDDLSRGGVEYVSFAQFHVPEAGAFQVRNVGETSRPVLVLRSDDRFIVAALVLFLLTPLGVLVAVVGGVLLVRALRTPKEPPLGLAPPWHPS